MIGRGLKATKSMWPSIRRAFGWVHRAANILGAEGARGPAVREQLSGLLGAMSRHRGSVDALGSSVDHFVKVSRSYWPGLFACYDAVGLPRTNNALEQAFGSHRYHKRRATGRKGASPALVLRGSARLIAGLATRAGEVKVSELAGANRDQWRRLRTELEQRRHRRVERRRFRQDAGAYLKALEDKLNQSRLPA